MVVDQLWSNEETAEYLGVSPKTLTKWRCTGEKPLRYVKIGRFAKYRPQDVQAFIESQVRKSGAAA